ncbi:ABC transporter ATP-binding protein [Protaetiibacter intestinalis]|uniref:ATP-binding cassette domain-containing protein n=1 Tax=Protaetiibacter intestinalis TaxID=2419774 RepID=A0A387B4H2_9MICO|nr:ATP-binding cassette domain-containing protein [Protaetiibacter intestinalis]AYF98492.1 ATP-binding cassette domain-containing protein [Protaetiibacter intestinalis]
MTTILEAIDIGFGYSPRVRLLNEWSASFREGEVVGITGSSGRGKSTLLYLLGLMLRPDDGSLLVDGQPVHSLSDSYRSRLRAQKFGFVFQDAVLDATRTVLDNVVETALYRGEARRDVVPLAMDLLERFGVQLRANAKPGQVSGGQAQRIALCRALLGRPRILLADEPTGNLDSESAEVVVRAFREHAERGSVVLIVSHDAQLVARCDRSIAL